MTAYDEGGSRCHDEFRELEFLPCGVDIAVI